MPGMLCAAVKNCPVFGAKVKSFDDAKVAGRPGVKGVVKVRDTGVAVVADTWWRAKIRPRSAADRVGGRPDAKLSDATIAAHLRDGLEARDQTMAAAATAMPSRRSRVRPRRSRRSTRTPFLAHATMEPMNMHREGLGR